MIKCLARLNGFGFDVDDDMLTIDKHGDVLLQIPLDSSLKQRLTEIAEDEKYYYNDALRTDRVLTLAALYSSEEKPFSWRSSPSPD